MFTLIFFILEKVLLDIIYLFFYIFIIINVFNIILIQPIHNKKDEYMNVTKKFFYLSEFTFFSILIFDFNKVF